MAKPSKLAESVRDVRKIEKRWGKALTAAGWTAVPSVLLKYQKQLGLEPLDMNILLQLAKHWWDAGNPPFPSKASIAGSIGVRPRSVQRRIAKMEKVGLIQRLERRRSDGMSQSNAYTFDGLIAKATTYAEQELATRGIRKKAKSGSGKPQLKVVK
jgi:hypothetical protein